jgi:HAD superfamily phosphoserine phosphatase-like hydrolase
MIGFLSQSRSRAQLIVEEDRSVRFKGLVVFDVDGTLIREKTVCEVIASKINRVERMDWLENNAGTPSTSTGLPPNTSVISAREEMADWYVEAGRESVDTFFESLIWADGAHTGIKSLIDNGWLVAIASLTWSFGVERIAQDLGVNEVIATELDWDTKEIRHVFAADKPVFLQKVVIKYGIAVDRVYAVGDSGGDIPMLKAAAHGFYIGNSDPKIAGTDHLPAARIDTIAELILNSGK